MDELERSLLNVFTYSDLNRLVRYRNDDTRLQSLFSDTSSRFVIFHRSQFLAKVQPKVKPLSFRASEIKSYALEVRSQVFLGSRGRKHYFAMDLTDSTEIEPVGREDIEFVDLRASGQQLKAESASMLSYAKAMFHWHNAHQFCGKCGSPTKPAVSGHWRRCIDSRCGKTHFPRTDPAIIVAVANEGKCLFGRQKMWPPYRYSVIAGFVEPGESIEQAVVREVFEETNIALEKVNYHSSQPWPFPGSIMLGFTATAASAKINLNDGELQDAHWRNVQEVVTGMVSGQFRLPPKLSIAYRLIEDWFDSHSDEKLADVMERLHIDQTW